MTRLLVFLAALILYVAPPAAQAFATSHVRPPGAALVQPTSADTESTPGADTEWPWGVIAAWVQAVGTILVFAAAVILSSRDHRRSINMFAEERGREEGIRHLRAHSLAHTLYPDLFEVKVKIELSEEAISRLRKKRDSINIRYLKKITQNWVIDIPEGFRSASENFFLLGTDTAPVVSQLLSLLHQHNRVADPFIESFHDVNIFLHALERFRKKDVFTDRLRVMKHDVEKALELVMAIRDKVSLPEYTLKAKDDQ